MPIYEYQCGKCGHRHEALQKISDAPLKVCPACKARSLKKLISAAGFRLSGGGWYETDFKSGSKRNIADKGEAAKDSGGDSKSSPKKDSAGSAGGSATSTKSSCPSCT